MSLLLVAFRICGVRRFGFTAGMICILITSFAGCRNKTSEPLSQDVYVWQRVWSESVEKAVEEAPARSGGKIREIVPLAAEVTFRNGRPSVIRPALSYKSLKTAPLRGLALRVGSFGGPFLQEDANCKFLTELACSLVSDAQRAGCAISELQIDFDCAESKLDGYRIWVAAIRDALHALPQPVPMCITTLPSWMDRKEFRPLVHEAGSFVLQVHSAELPNPGEKPVLCDPGRARRWVQKAATFDTPFRVALPTYTSLVAVNEVGKIVGVFSEGQPPAWPGSIKTFTARADAPRLSQLVCEWKESHPATLTGIVWYRLPVSDDRMNWRWPTLLAVMNGQKPRSNLHVDVSSGNPADITVMNDGEQDEPVPHRVGIRWNGANLVASDALSGFALENTSGGIILTQNATDYVLPPGERRIIGWLRLDTPAKIYVTEN